MVFIFNQNNSRIVQTGNTINIVMKIDELISVRDKLQQLAKDDPTGNKQAVWKLLEDHDFMMAGSPGWFGSVWYHPNLEYVLKIFSSRDRGYLKFLDVASAHQDNPHFPKFRGKLVKLTPLTMAVRLERLNVYSRHKFEDIEYMLDTSSGVRNWRKYIENNEIAKDFINQWPQFGEALDLLNQSWFNNEASINFDWHDGNMMLRNNQVPVIIDPFKPTGLF